MRKEDPSYTYCFWPNDSSYIQGGPKMSPSRPLGLAYDSFHIVRSLPRVTLHSMHTGCVPSMHTQSIAAGSIVFDAISQLHDVIASN
jgi:hypothetical protein